MKKLNTAVLIVALAALLILVGTPLASEPALASNSVTELLPPQLAVDMSSLNPAERALVEKMFRLRGIEIGK
jgi:hypothetical protein